MLHHLNEHNAALHINAALAHVYTEKKHVTRDVGGKAGTSEFADAVIEALKTIPVPVPVAREAEL
jgi:isocitrate dehydrogenase (NAD+)